MTEHDGSETWLEQTLTAYFQPSYLDIEDQSYLHAGHAGSRSGSHFVVTLVSESFQGLSLVQRHRLVYQAVTEKINKGIHALQLHTLTAAEFAEKT